LVIDSRWIDVDLAVVPDDQGGGWIEQTGDEMCAATPDVPSFADVFPQHMVPKSQWKELILARQDIARALRVPIVSQGREGSCVGFSCTNALMNTIIQRFGRRNWVDLSGVSLYKRIGRSASSGAYIPDGIKELQVGVLPVDSAANKGRYSHTHPRTGFSVRLPSGWQETAKLFSATAVATCRGADEIVSASLGSFQLVVGRSRHAINYDFPAVRGGDVFMRYRNTWGIGWGDEGNGYDSERVFSGLTAYAILDVVTRPDIFVPEI
jgi:hypothetical protein